MRLPPQTPNDLENLSGEGTADHPELIETSPKTALALNDKGCRLKGLLVALARSARLNASQVAQISPAGLLKIEVAGSRLHVLGTSSPAKDTDFEARYATCSTGGDVVLIRLECALAPDRHFTVDVLQENLGRWHRQYIPWRHPNTGETYLVRSQGVGPVFRFDPSGLQSSARCPFINLFERELGYAAAIRSISDAMGVL